MFFKRALTTVLIVFVILAVTGSSARAENDLTEAQKLAAFNQIMKDTNILQLADQIRRDPGNKTAVDSLLFRLTISPLDLFRVRMESQKLEYVIPREVQQLHERWMQIHSPVWSSEYSRRTVETAMMLNPALAPIAPMAATVGTNKDVASTYTPAPANYQGEIQLSVNKNNSNQIVAAANTWDKPSGCDQTQAVFSTTDGGANWRYTCAPSVGAFGLSCPSGGLALGSDPAVAWDNSNNVYLNYMMLCCDTWCQFGLGNPSSSLVVAKSTNSGSTWAGLGVIINHLSSSSAGLDDKQFYSVDNTPGSPYYGRHYQCWDNNNNELFAYSTNGVSWTQVDLPSAGSGLLDLGCEMAVGSNGTVHLAWDALTCGTNDCSGEATYYTRSTNGGASWSAPVLIKAHNVVSFNPNSKIPAQDERGINPFGAIDVDNTGGAYSGRLYMAYSDVASGAAMATSDVYVSRSTDNGSTWSTGVKVNDDATSTAQFHPFLAVDQTNGSVVVGWHDARNDSGNKRVDFYMTRSTDGGATFEANVKVSQPSSEFSNNTISYSDESSNNSGNNGNQYGEYLGVDATGGKGYMAWTDTRQYFPSNTSNTQKENLGFATVTFSASGDTTAPTTSITAPTAGSTVSGTTTVSASASDNVGVTKVDFYLDGATLLGTDTTSPYSMSWDTTAATNGSHTLSSKAYDAANNVGTSANVSVTVSNTTTDMTPPTTSITAPAAGATVSSTVAVNANASDNVGVVKVEFYLDGATLLGTDTTSPFSINWNTTTATNGAHTLTSKAYDAANNVGTSAGVGVTVSNSTTCGTGSQLFGNPGFESGNTIWYKYSSTGSTAGIITNSASRPAHTGTWYAWLNGFGLSTTQYIRQQVSVPSNACSAQLSFWLRIDTAEITTVTAYDTLQIQVRKKNADGTWGSWSTKATYSNLNANSTYVQKTFDLASYKGATIQVRFYGKEDGALQTSFVLDDTAVNITQ